MAPETEWERLVVHYPIITYSKQPPFRLIMDTTFDQRSIFLLFLTLDLHTTRPFCQAIQRSKNDPSPDHPPSAPRPRFCPSRRRLNNSLVFTAGDRKRASQLVYSSYFNLRDLIISWFIPCWITVNILGPAGGRAAGRVSWRASRPAGRTSGREKERRRQWIYSGLLHDKLDEPRTH